jgi:CheY-like chemotaxis protein
MISDTVAARGSVVRVLIVDDNPDVGKVLSILLDQCGYAVDIVNDGLQCLTHVESFQPDVVLLDIAMPKICGYDLARQIRARPEFERVSIIAITGYGGPERAQLSLDAGCDLHLMKPVSLAALESAIAKEIERHTRPLTSGGRKQSARRTPAVMNPLRLDASAEGSLPLMTRERTSALKRLGEISVALGNPTWTPKQSAALLRERAELELALTTDDSDQQPE